MSVIKANLTPGSTSGKTRSIRSISRRCSAELGAIDPEPALTTYTCDICGKSVNSQYNLAKHTISHGGDREVKCPASGCNLKYSNKSNCLRHYRRAHWDVSEPPKFGLRRRQNNRQHRYHPYNIQITKHHSAKKEGNGGDEAHSLAASSSVALSDNQESSAGERYRSPIQLSDNTAREYLDLESADRALLGNITKTQLASDSSLDNPDLQVMASHTESVDSTQNASAPSNALYHGPVDQVQPGLARAVSDLQMELSTGNAHKNPNPNSASTGETPSVRLEAITHRRNEIVDELLARAMEYETVVNNRDETRNKAESDWHIAYVESYQMTKLALMTEFDALRNEAEKIKEKARNSDKA